MISNTTAEIIDTPMADKYEHEFCHCVFLIPVATVVSTEGGWTLSFVQ